MNCWTEQSRLIRSVRSVILRRPGTGKIILWSNGFATLISTARSISPASSSKISYETHHAKEVTAHSAAQLAASLGADAALITWLGSGNAFVDVMLTIKACEQRGIKTVLVTYEYGGKDGADSPLLYYAEQADAVVSTGSRDRWLTLPAADRVVGPYEEIRLLSYPGAPTMPAHGALTLDARDMIVGGVDISGSESWTCAVY